MLCNICTSTCLSRSLNSSFTPSPSVLLIGDSGVGKTGLISRFVHEEFKSGLKTTVGVDFHTKCIEVGSEVIKVNVRDTGLCIHAVLIFSFPFSALYITTLLTLYIIHYQRSASL